MAELQSDGVLDEAEGNMRQALMAAAQLARSATHARKEAFERATRRDLDAAKQLQGQLDAQRLAARAVLAPVHERSWWDQAQTRDVARAYQTAVTFRDEDQAARDAESRIRQELRDRYGVDVNETGADPSVVQAALVDREGTRWEQKDLQEQARTDQDVAAGLTVTAEALELTAKHEDADEAAQLRKLAADVEQDAQLTWDSAERREAHIARIQSGEAQPTAATAWKQADVDNARHPREAIASKTETRKPRVSTTAPSKQIERGRH